MQQIATIKTFCFIVSASLHVIPSPLRPLCRSGGIWHDFCMYIPMKVGIMLFRNIVSPRLDIADSLLVYDIDNENGVVKKKEQCSLAFDHPTQLISFLQENEVKKIICGGCPQFLSRMLVFHGFDMVAGLTGDPGHIEKMLVEGKLGDLRSSESSSFGSGFGRRRRSWRGHK